MPRSSVASSVTALSSSSSSSGSLSQSGKNPLPFTRSYTDFEMERAERLPRMPPSYTRSPPKGILRKSGPVPEPHPTEDIFQTTVTSLMKAKSRPFSISGHIPLEPGALTIFFRSQSGLTHSLDFPIDVESESPPELDTLIAACKPHVTCEMDGFSDRESLYYPASLPLTSTLELANHPILDAIRTALFPRLATGQYLVAVRDLLELVPTGGHMCPQRRLPQEEGKVATIIVTLPVRYRGGALVIHDFEGNEEKYYGRGGKPGDLEWTAFLADCEHEVETVQRGVRLTISYNVFLRTFGPSPSPAQSLLLPSDFFLDLISPILNLSRGQRIAFYLQEQYGFSPADILAESLVPHLKGGDALLYHSLRLYKLVPELRWAAGGYVWPVDSAVECGNLVRTPSQRHLQLRNSVSMSMSPNSRHRRQYSGNVNGNGKPGFSLVEYRDSGSSESDDDDLANVAVNVRDRVEGSGAVLLEEAGIRLLVDDLIAGAVTKERVPYVSSGALDKLVINVLLVVYVP